VAQAAGKASFQPFFRPNPSLSSRSRLAENDWRPALAMLQFDNVLRFGNAT
jgi:hypothetical protein